MAASFSYWKGFIDKTLKDRKRRLPLDDMDNMVKRKDIIRTLIDDHRDVAMYRHALCAIHLKLIGMSSGATPHYEDGTGLFVYFQGNKPITETYRGVGNDSKGI